MSRGADLAGDFAGTKGLIERFATGLTNEDSVQVPDFNVNSFNWVLGHILVSRDRVLTLIGESQILSDAERETYDTGSAPVEDVTTAVSLERLLAALEESQMQINRALPIVKAEALTVIFDEKRQTTVDDRIAGLHWHETYHVGQLEILRQFSGNRDPFP